ncbi:MAG: hypothetical protein HC879_20955 [Leptolyngbyaceae cyanobacterium SL_5_9]|nr:hypothetical protein [Leptolyngbyaceae cyanobacterium SL_5_9]NJO76720.1 hypothetical protein [Leptolyngbyaceae cyanobacterium RM1_406_9]
MSDSQTLMTLAQWLAGEFDNRQQASEQPAWFVHLRLWQRPLRQRIQENLALFVEQANALYLNQPYRQRVIVLSEKGDRLQAEYLALKHPDQFRGAGANADLLSKLEASDLEPLPGCVLSIIQQSSAFKAQPLPQTKCCFEYEGKIRQVVLGFDVSSNSFASYDRGVNPETGQGLWGALMGPYEFSKCEDFAAELPN